MDKDEDTKTKSIQIVLVIVYMIYNNTVRYIRKIYIMNNINMFYV